MLALILEMQRAPPMQDGCAYNNPKFHLIKLDQQSVRDASCATGVCMIPDASLFSVALQVFGK